MMFYHFLDLVICQHGPWVIFDFNVMSRLPEMSGARKHEAIDSQSSYYSGTIGNFHHVCMHM